MNIQRIVRFLILVFVFLCGSVSLAWGMNQVPSVSNNITTASIDANKTLTVSGKLVRELFYEGKIYAVVNFNGSDYTPIDQVVSEDIFAVNPGADVIDYSISFDLNFAPTVEDQLVMIWRNENAIPLDVDPITLGEDTVYATERVEVAYKIETCRHDDELNLIFCAHTGDVPTNFEVEWFKDSVYNGKTISKETSEVVLENNSFALATKALPSGEGLYPFVIRDESGRHVYQGSSRVGKVVIPELLPEKEETVLDGIDIPFVSQIAALVIGFIALILLAAVLLMGTSKMKYVYAVILALLIAGLGYWYQAQAAVYESTDYRQFRYTISLNPVTDDEYWLSYAAIDTYTSAPPQRQRVQMTLDGTTFVDVIDDSTGAWSHTRGVTVPESASTTAAIRIVDGCASYFGFTSFDGVATYGTRDCAPIALFPSEDSIIGCMNPNATNYNPQAVIESGDCQFTGCVNPTAVNYNPQATIDDGSCVIIGCMNPNADNYNPQANQTDNSCRICVNGNCGPCTPATCGVLGCTNPASPNYDPLATVDDGTCGVCENGVCDIAGCTNPASPNYDANATIDDGSCSACYWTPVVPNPTTYCSFESYTQTNSCTGDTRVVPGTQSSSWAPDLRPADICVGYSIAQEQTCSGVTPAPRRVINGTGTDAFCIIPDTDFLISTNLVNWTTCSAIGSLRLVRPDQPLYLRSAGNVRIDNWSVTQAAGEITGTVSNHRDEVYKISFAFPVQQKSYADILIRGTTFAGNTTQQSCDLSLLNFDIKEI